jgi:adenylate kinase family enzyme
MQRVLVIGCSGAGKSTFSRRLASVTGLPRIELDHAYWRAGWTMPPKDEWGARVAELCAEPAWILDGNFTGSLNIRLPRADTVIWLDYPRLVCIRRVLGRIARDYGRVRDGLPEGCPERLDLEFLRFIWNFNAKTKPRLIAAVEQFGSHAKLHALRSDRDAERLLAEVSSLAPAQLSASQLPQPSLRSAPPSHG